MKRSDSDLIKRKSASRKPLFFLFTCVKEGRPYIKKLFESLLIQTRHNFVHYIYEDGSNDPVEDLVLEYKGKASKLDIPYDVIYEKNSVNIGLNLATKHCIDMCFCPYFIWIDCDNWISETFFEELEKYILKHKKVTLVRTKLLDQNGKNVFPKNITRKQSKNKQLKNFLFRQFAYGFFCVKKNDYLRINPDNYLFDDKNFFNDDQVILTCLLNNNAFGFCKKSIGYFLDRNDNESKIYKINDIDKLYFLFQNLVLRYDKNLSLQISYLPYLRKSLNRINELKRSSTIEALQLFNCRCDFIKSNNVWKDFRYKHGNKLYWKTILKICFLEHLIRKR